MPGRLGIADGRYLVRGAEGEADDVIVISSGTAPARGRSRRQRRKARVAEAGTGMGELPASRATIVRATAFEGEGEAAGWLESLRGEANARDEFVSEALGLLNVALHAHRAATMDPYVMELSAHSPSSTRVGFGDGDAVAAGRWSEAVDAPPDPGRRQRRIEALLPQERVAAVLGRREDVAACETLVLRARLDLDHDRLREAALQLEPAIAAVLAEIAPGAPEDQLEDVSALRDATEGIRRARQEALTGELSPEAAAAVSEALEVCERILRRRRITGQG